MTQEASRRHSDVYLTYNYRLTATTVLQHSRHADCRTMYRFRRIGRRRFRLHADGFPYFHPAGIVHGKRNRFFLAIWTGRTDSLRRSIYVSVLLIGTVTLILNIAVFVWIHPSQDIADSQRYLWHDCMITCGLSFGESALPLSIISMRHCCVP